MPPFLDFRRAFLFLLVVAAQAFAWPAQAGDFTYAGIMAATPDGKYVALFSGMEGATAGDYAGLVESKPRSQAAWDATLIVKASCCKRVTNKPTFADFTWEKRTPEVQALRAFSDLYDDKSAGKRARVVIDPETNLARLEILQAERWWPMSSEPGEVPDVNGTLGLPGCYVIRLHRYRDLHHWDELRVFTESQVPQIGARWLRTRGEAAAATGALRELRAQGKRPFTNRPNGRRNQDAWDYRRAQALDPVILKWETAAAFGPLTPQDLLDLVWLYAFRDAPGQKLRALRLVTSLKKRDARAAAALLAELEKDADTAAIVPLLLTGHDPLRNLPTSGLVAEDSLRSLGDEELRWLHRLARAQGGFRFSDPVAAEYFALFDWYKPVPQKAWNGLLVDRFFMKDPDKSVLVAYNKTLQAIRNVEKERGLAPPEL